MVFLTSFWKQRRSSSFQLTATLSCVLYNTGMYKAYRMSYFSVKAKKYIKHHYNFRCIGFTDIKQVTSLLWKASQIVIWTGSTKRTQLAAKYSIVLEIKMHQTGITLRKKKTKQHHQNQLCSVHIWPQNQPWISIQISEEKKKLDGNHQDQQQNTKLKQKS